MSTEVSSFFSDDDRR